MTAAVQYLLDLPRFAGQAGSGYQPGLDRIRTLLATLGDPHRVQPVIHVAGTNGKGSTASMIAAMGQALGLRVGLHTSPHLHHLAERMRLNGVPAPLSWLDTAVERYRPALEAAGLSFFEATVALSFRYFADMEVDLAVVEVGLGGRLDATNVVEPVAAVLTHIGLDHTALLGDTRAAIAREKAGIIKERVPVVSAVDHPEAVPVIAEVAAGRRAPLHRLDEEVTWTTDPAATPHPVLQHVRTPQATYTDLALDLPGRHQVRNALLALRTMEIVYRDQPGLADAVRNGLAHTRRYAGLRGRAEVIRQQPSVLLDVGHNVDGLREALRVARGYGGESPPVVVLGLLRDKDAVGIGALLADSKSPVVVVGLDTERGYGAAALAEALRATGASVIHEAPTVAQGLRWTLAQAHPDDVVLATGSHQVVAAVVAVLPGRGTEPTLQIDPK